MTVKKYRKKPVVIEAIQFTGGNFAECCAFDAGIRVRYVQHLPRFLEVDTLEGDGLTAVPGDYIIEHTVKPRPLGRGYKV